MSITELNECSLLLRLVGFRSKTTQGSHTIEWHSPKHADVYIVSFKDSEISMQREYSLEETVEIESSKQLKQYI